ncbi:hypothetical protein [Hymenobacter sp. UYP22]|uniref:hypothetical protein n=1 Tax=Hymenobacter sp. UYP22 TaxID=3156348 RepID=UPI0033910A07
MKLFVFAFRSGLLGFSLLISSCSLFGTGGHTTAEGVVVDSVTGEPIGQAQVCLFSNKRSSSSSAFNKVGDCHDTDAQGKYSFSFEADEDLEYILRADSKSGYTDFVTAPKLKGGRKNKDIRVPINALAWVAVHLLDVPPRATALNVTVWGFYEPVMIRPPLDTVFYREVPVGDSNIVTWQLNGSVTVPNLNTEHRIPFTVKGLDTARIEIRY